MTTGFKHLKVGDKVIRKIGHDGPEKVGTVMQVDEKVLKFAMPGAENWSIDQLWTFDRETGVEEDEGLHWGVAFGRTGSFLKLM